MPGTSRTLRPAHTTPATPATTIAALTVAIARIGSYGPLVVAAGTALVGLAVAPAIGELSTVEAAGEGAVAFTATQIIMIVGGLLASVTGALSLMFKMLLAAQAKTFEVQINAHQEGLRLKDETIHAVQERLRLKDSHIAEKEIAIKDLNESLRTQSDRMLGMLDVTVGGTREVLLQVKDSLNDHSIVIKEMAASLSKHTDSNATLLTNVAQGLARIPQAYSIEHRPANTHPTFSQGATPPHGPTSPA